MTTLLTAPACSRSQLTDGSPPALPRRVASSLSPLRVRRQEIEFFSLTPQRVRIQIQVHNTGQQASAPTTLIVQSASFGAFLPWQRLTSLSVPGIAAGGRTVLQTDVDRDQLAPESFGGGGMRRRRLTATGSDDLDPRVDAGLRRLQGAKVLAGGPGVWFGDRSVHWVGNLNILVGGRSVERHRARALRVHAGRVNIASFRVGRDPSEEYAFSLSGSALSGCADLHRWPYQPGRREAALPLNQWQPGGAVLLAVDIPPDHVTGELAVHVRRRSTMEEAVVEFSLDANAKGPGCYSV